MLLFKQSPVKLNLYSNKIWNSNNRSKIKKQAAVTVIILVYSQLKSKANSLTKQRQTD